MVRKIIRMIYPIVLYVGLFVIYESVNRYYMGKWLGDTGANICALVVMILLAGLCLLLGFFNTREIDRKNQRIWYILGVAVVLAVLVPVFYMMLAR